MICHFHSQKHDKERKLYRTLSEDFMPEIPKLFDLKEKQQRRKLLQRNNLRKLCSKDDLIIPFVDEDEEPDMGRAKPKSGKSQRKQDSSKSKDAPVKEETPPPPPPPAAPVQKKGRQTNNSLASAVGQIVIHTRDEEVAPSKKKSPDKQPIASYVSANYEIGIEEEERRVGMHKVLESLKDHEDAWPFVDPVDEEYAPRYYSVVRKPMDLSTMEEKLEGVSYKTLSQFKHDFRLIVDNCKQYNGSENGK